MKPSEGSRTSDFWRILFDFENKPGRYALVLRQPRVLFDNSRLLLQLCSGRVTSDLAELQIPEERARAAAKFFVKTAMLRHGADNYTLLGLTPGFEESELKDNYRLLMRLTHPDFAGQGEGWPEDAATRVNRAYDILASESSRQAYEQTLDMQAYGQSSPEVESASHKRSGLVRALLYILIGVGSVLAAFNWWKAPPAPVASTAVPVEVTQTAASAAQTPDQVVAESVRRSLAGAPVEAVVTTAQASVNSAVSTPISTAASGTFSERSSFPANSGIENAVAAAGRAASPTALPRPALTTMPATTARVDELNKQERLVKATSSVIPAVRTEPIRAETVRGEPAAPAGAASQSPSTKPGLGADMAPSQGAPKLGEVQPYLSGLISSMLSGREASVLAMIDKPVQQTDGAVRFIRQYAQTVRGAEEVKMGSLQLKSHVEGGYLIVEGAIHFVLLDTNRTPIVRELRIRAYYGTQGGQTHLAALYPG